MEIAVTQQWEQGAHHQGEIREIMENVKKNLPDMEKSWNSISWEKSWKSDGNSNYGKENLFRFALQCLYYHIGRDLIKISLDPNMPCSLAEICAMTLY